MKDPQKVFLTDSEIQAIIMALDEKIDRLKALHLSDNARLNNLESIKNFLETHL